ncbi:MAG: M28 family metallopeptidase [Actinomycetota bacterium]
MSTHRRLAAVLAVGAFLISACTGEPAAGPTPSPSASSSSPSPSPRPVVARFDAGRALAHDRVLAVTIGSREAASPAYVRASRYVGSVFASFGYGVTQQRVPVPSGKSQGVPVNAGFTRNVIAVPPGFDPLAPHLVVGAHLDTVTPSPGGNDNGSGVAVMLELARLASIGRTAMPVVWIAFGGEERRRPGMSGATYGSRYYLARLSAAEKKAIHGMIAIDMVGNGPRALICHERITGDEIIDALLASARKLKLPAAERIVLGTFSDHAPFERAGYTVGWLWSGEHATLHTPRDTFAIVQRSSLDRIGRITWDTLATLRL